MDMNTAVSLLSIKEDLLEDEAESVAVNPSAREFTPASTTRKARVTKAKRIKVEIKSFERLLTTASIKLGCTASELSDWLNPTPNTPETVQKNALRLITKHNLDPFLNEIDIHQYEDRHWQVFITIDGWSRLINNHPAFKGISFTESEELINGVPTWMVCAIYRNDRVIPIEVKEYFSEIKTEHSIWKEMPRRMLRYRVTAQCARLAFGVSVPDTPGIAIEIRQKVNSKGDTTNIPRSNSIKLKERLKNYVIS